MFQRFKNAYDQVLEEAQRPRSPNAPTPRRNTSTQRPPASSPARRRPTRPTKDNVNLSEPDPDPTEFDVEKDDAPEEAQAQEQAERVVSGVEVPAEKTEDGIPQAADNSSNEATGEQSTSQIVGDESVKLEQQPPQADLPTEVRTKLAKLDKLEAKYQQLLQAYRKAHARNSLIEPFEAKLREVTPLTTIGEPTAFVEYLNQIQQRSDMVMQELRKASNDKDELSKKLEDSEQKLKDTTGEIVLLKQDKERGVPIADSESDPPASSESGSMQKGTKDMFSYDDEVPRLQSDLEERDGRIATLQTEKLELEKDLASARESAEHMVEALEDKQNQLESLKSAAESTETSREMYEEQIGVLDKEVSSLKTKLNTHDEESGALNARLQSSGIEITELKNKLSTSYEQRTAAEKIRQTVEDQVRKYDVDLREQKECASRLQEELEQLKTTTSSAARANTMVNGIPQGSPPSTSATTELPQSQSNKKNKKKKKKGTVASTVKIEAPRAEEGKLQSEEHGHNTRSVDPSQIQKRLDDTLKELHEKNAALDQLQEKLQKHEDMKEEIEHLREELTNVGEEHVDAKDRVKSLEADRKVLEDELAALKADASQSGTKMILMKESEDLKERHASLEAERNQLVEQVKALEIQIAKHDGNMLQKDKEAATQQHELSEELHEVKSKADSLQNDLAAAQQLASARFKEISNLQSNVQKLRPELSSLRSEVSDLRSTRDELAIKASEVRNLELRESRIKTELEALKKQTSAKEVEMKRLNEKISSESSQRSSLEESNRRLDRGLQRSQKERHEATTARDSYLKKFSDSDAEATKLRSRAQELESRLEQLNSDTTHLREEMSLKSAQHASAQSMMNNLRDQSSEMATQLKEAKEKAESLEEELTDAHRLMNERGRESETLRRILADVETRADSRVKEMREQMEVATQERDRAEEEANTIGRRRGRELDEVKNKLRETERDLRRAQEEKSDVQRTESDLRQRTAEDAEKMVRAHNEMAEVRKAMAELRDALDESERQSRELDAEKLSVQRTLEHVQTQLEKLQKSNKTASEELKSLRATRVRPTDSGAQSSRSSMDSNLPGRIASPTTNGREEARKGSAMNSANIDYVYLKNVLLQFLEQKDRKYQAQLIPVLGMLLHFDKKDEQRWMSAVNAQ